MGVTSVKERWAIIAKWEDGQTARAISQQLGTPLKTVQRWVERYRATGHVQDQPRSGRPPLLEAAAAQKACDLLLGGKHGASKSVAQHLHASGHVSKVVDRRTVSRAARKVARESGVRLRAVRGKPGKLLTAATRRKRLEFCRANRSRSWGATLFTDRKKFLFSYPDSIVPSTSWVVEGGRREALTVNHPQAVNVYVGLCKYGLTRLHIVAGTSGAKSAYKNQQGKGARNITMQEYRDVLKSTLLPEGRRLFSMHGISTWLLQQDNDPTHKAAGSEVAQWRTQHYSSVSILPNWPPNSPDLNPIENLWSYLQAKMDENGCATFSEFKAALVLEAKSITKTYCSKLVDSMHKRIAECIRLEGAKTKY
jgi:hypothetical protein